MRQTRVGSRETDFQALRLSSSGEVGRPESWTREHVHQSPRQSIGLLQLVGQSLSIGPLVDVALFLGIVAWWLNLRGAEAAPQAQLVIVSVSVIPFLITAIAVVIRPEAENTLAVFAWNHAHGGDLFAALLFCILLFGGFETVAAFAEETADPRRNIPIALVGTVSLTAAIPVFCSYAGTIHYGPDHVAKDWGGRDRRLGGRRPRGRGTLGGDLDPAGGTRRLHGHLHRILTGGIPWHPVARPAGLLPEALARTNRGGAPVAAATVILAAAVLFIAGGLLIPPDRRFTTLFVAGTAQALLLVVVYTGLALGALRLMLRSPARQPGWRWVVFPAAAVVPLLAVYGTFVPFPERYGLHAGMLTLGLVIVWAVRASTSPPAR